MDFENLDEKEHHLLKTLSSPKRIQDFLDNLPINHEKEGETCYSPRTVILHKKAHCLEGALLAAAALMYHGEKARIVNFRTEDKDEDHAITLFEQSGYLGAFSKTNHAILRFRDPLYRTLRELSLSFAHEYFMFEDGKKTLRAYSRPLVLPARKTEWITSPDAWDIAHKLRDMPHYPLVPSGLRLRSVSSFERGILRHSEWEKTDSRT